MFGILYNLMSLILYAILGYRLKFYFREDDLLKLCMRVVVITTLLLSFLSLRFLYDGWLSIEFMVIWHAVPVMSLYAGYRLSIKKKMEVA